MFLFLHDDYEEKDCMGSHRPDDGNHDGGMQQE